MTQLHDLTGQYLALSRDEDLPLDAIADTLEAIDGAIEEKAVSLVKWGQDIDGDISKLEVEIDRLSKKKKALVNRKDSLIEYIKTNMEARGMTNIKCPLFSITCVKGPDVVEVFSETSVPDEFVNVKTVISPDKVKIKAALKAGEDIAGCRIVSGKSSLRIK